MMTAKQILDRRRAYGKRLKYKRQRYDISITKLALETGMPRTTIHRLESAAHAHSVDTYIRYLDGIEKLRKFYANLKKR